MMNHKPRSRVVIEDLRKDISTHASSIPIVQENVSQVDNISLPSRGGRIVGTSADGEPRLVHNLHSVSQLMHSHKECLIIVKSDTTT